MKEYGNDSVNIDVDNSKLPYKREKPSFKQNPKRLKTYHKNILEDPDSSTLIELSNKKSLKYTKTKSNTVYAKNNMDEKTAENLILENKRKLTRLTKKTYYDKSQINLTQEQKRYRVNITKRNYSNNIYINNIDQSISFVIPYKYKCNIYMFIFLGIPYIITKFSNRKLIEWRSEPCRVVEADFYLIIDGYGNYHICDFTKKGFTPNFSAENRIKGYDNKYIATLFSSIEIYNKIEYHEIFYVYNKYYCYKKIRENDVKKNLNQEFEDNNNNYNNQINSISNDTVTQSNRLNKDYYFESQIFNMAFTTNEEIYNIFETNFMKQREIQFQLDIYGPNKLILKNINYLTILLEKIINFVTIYILIIIIFYCIEKYYYFIVILVLSIILLLITAYQKYLNQKKVVDFSLNNQEKITVYEGPKNPPRLIDYESLVPGQVIKIKEKDILPCDCLLLEGFCSVIESSLTGESSSIMKYKLPKNSSNFNYSDNMKSYLFCGTKIENCFPKELKALVIGTGFNTQRGNLIQSVLVPRKSNYNFYKENITFFIFTFVFFIIGMVIFIILDIRQDDNNTKGGGNLFENILDLFAMAIPSSLPLALTLGTFYYQYSLINKQISCSGVYRLMAAGKINKLIFDKTGTLTEEDLELHGYISSIKKDGYLILDSREKNSKLYLSNLSEYYKNEFHNRIIELNQDKKNNEENIDIKSSKNEDNISDKEEEPKKKKDDTNNTITYFMECLATCHSVTKINDENKGNSIDIKIFNEVNWIYDPLNLTSYSNDQFEVKPKKYFKITEEQFFMKNKNTKINLSENEELNSYKLKVIYRSHFESRNQSMSVIVKNNFNNSIRLYTKGAPEKIIRQCLDYSIPLNYDEVYRKYTLQGYRVLACAMKLISENGEKEEEIISNEEYQNYRNKDLIFLGLILFQNKIKTHTKKVLQKLKNDGLFPIISTGDNAFTSISLVKECNLVKNNSKFCIMEMDSSNLDDNKKDKKSKNININQHGFIQCTLEEVNYDKPSKNSTETFAVVLSNKIEPNDYEIYNRSNFRNKSSSLLNIGEFNNKILRENDMKLCIHSQVFDYIFFHDKEGSNDNNKRESLQETNLKEEKDEELNLLRQIIVDRGILFFRMSPNDKAKLIQLFKKQNPNNIVAMCGDGANDCSALISADVGVSLKSRENIIMTSHLMAKTKSIAVINDIISIGKACYENSNIILKILLVYSEIKICSRCLLKIYNDNLTKGQYFYLDCFIILFGCCLMSISSPNYKIKEKTYSRLLISKIYLISIIGHSIIQLGLLIIYFFCIIENEEYYFDDQYEKNQIDRDLYSDNKTALNSYLFYFNSNQCLTMVFLLNFFSKCKQSVLKGRLFITYIILVFIVLSEILSLGNFEVGIFKAELVKFVQLNSEGTNSQYSRLILLAFCVGNFFITMIWEFFINWIMELYYCKFVESKDEKVSKKNKRNFKQNNE